MAALEVGVQRRELEGLEHDLRFALHVLERVDREPLQLAADRGARGGHDRLDLVRVANDALADELVVAPDLAVLGDADDVALVESLEQLGPDPVDETDARAEKADRAAVRVAAADRVVDVEHRDDPGVDEPVGRDAVEVAVVDDGDLAGFGPLHEVLGPAVDADRAGDHRLLGDLAGGPEPEVHDGDLRRRLAAACRRGLRRFEQLGGVPARRVRAEAGEHPRQLGDPRVAVDGRRARDRPAAELALRHRDLGVGVRRDLGEVRHAQDLVAPGQLGEVAADRHAGLAADAGVDLVEDQRRGRLRQHQPERQHRPRELAAGCGAGQGRAGSPGFAESTNVTVSAPSSPASPGWTSTSIRAAGMARSARCPVTCVPSGPAAERRAADSRWFAAAISASAWVRAASSAAARSS